MVVKGQWEGINGRCDRRNAVSPGLCYTAGKTSQRYEHYCFALPNLNTQYISESINPNVEGTVIISRPQRHTFGEATQIKIGNKAITHCKIEKSNLTYLDLNGAFDSKIKQSKSCFVEGGLNL